MELIARVKDGSNVPRTADSLTEGNAQKEIKPS